MHLSIDIWVLLWSCQDEDVANAFVSLSMLGTRMQHIAGLYETNLKSCLSQKRLDFYPFRKSNAQVCWNV